MGGAGTDGVPVIVDFVSAADQMLRDLHQRVGLDAWWITRRQGSDQVVLAAVGGVHGHEVGAVRSWEHSFCRRMLDGEAPQVAPRVADVPAYVQARGDNGLDAAAVLSVPITSPTGEVLGTVCALSHTEQPHLAAALPVVALQAGVLGVLLAHELQLVDQVRRTERAERAAHTDALTGVANRRGWDAALAGEEARATRYASSAAVVVLDLDGLKVINDARGHDAGDELLRRTAVALAARLRTSDVLARLGGDEFAALLPETDLGAALTVCDQLRAVLAEEGISASFGVGARRGRSGLRAAWRRADAAMYLDKASAERATGPTSTAGAAGPTGAADLARPAPAALLDATGDGPDGVDVLLGMVRDQLGADVAFVRVFEGDSSRFRNLVTGVDLPFGAGHTEPRADTYCQYLVEGRVGPVTPDVPASVLGPLPVTRALGVGSYVGVPLRRRGGQLYGTLCTASRHTDPGLRDRDAGVLHAVAGAVMDLVERDDDRAARRHAVLDRLDALRAAGGPRTVHQPVLALEGLRQVGVEALSRFPPGTGGPARWFADAAAAGVGPALELDAAAAALTGLPGVEGFLCLNASAAAITSPAFARLLAAAPLERLVLEVTGHEAVPDHEALVDALEPLRHRGLRVAADGIGAGASMRYVLALVPDLIKLDLGLVRGIDADPPRQALARALATFAAATGAALVAVGIETPAELERLRGLGVAYGQGHHLAPPAPPAGATPTP